MVRNRGPIRDLARGPQPRPKQRYSARGDYQSQSWPTPKAEPISSDLPPSHTRCARGHLDDSQFPGRKKIAAFDSGLTNTPVRPYSMHCIQPLKKMFGHRHSSKNSSPSPFLVIRSQYLLSENRDTGLPGAAGGQRKRAAPVSGCRQDYLRGGILKGKSKFRTNRGSRA
jgi:hypothetical protein